MRKTYLLGYAILFIVGQLFAQNSRPIGDRNYLGFEGGLNYNWYNVPPAGFTFITTYPFSNPAFPTTYEVPFRELGSGIGWQLGLTGDLNLASRLALMGKLMYRRQSTSHDEVATIECPDILTPTTGEADVRRTFDGSYGFFGGDLLLRYQIDPDAWYLFGGIGLASLVSNSVTLSEEIIASNNDCQYYDGFGFPQGTQLPIFNNDKLVNFFNSTYASPKLGFGTFIPIGESGTMLTPELSVSMPLTEWIDEDAKTNKSADYPKLWFASLTVGIKFPWGGNARPVRTDGGTETILAGHVRDRQTSAPIEDAEVTIVDLSTNEEVDDQSTDENGAYGIQLYPGRYSVTAEAKGYLFNSTYIEVDQSGKITRGNPDIYLTRPPAKIRLLVFFDFNKTELQEESYPELKRALKFMRDNPEMGVEIAGHTDNVGSDQYNKDLSQKRANTVMEYLVSQGVDKKRLSAIGYGEEQPIDSNESEDGRANNRRVEFIVKKL